MESMFQTLMEIPLFKGVSYQKLSEIIGKHRFHFMKFSDGETIISADDPCTHLSTLISGKARVTTTCANRQVHISQTIQAPEIIAPEFFFGPQTRYPATITAIGTCGVMQLDKKDYTEILKSDSIFLFNFLNILSLKGQLSTNGVLLLTSGDLRKRIAYWIIALTQRNAMEITLETDQGELCDVLGVTRQALASTLADMKAEGLLDYTANKIEINDRRQLSEFLYK
jgi:CRP-like cAMP-binding protein